MRTIVSLSESRIVLAHGVAHSPTFALLGPFVPLFVMSGAPRLPSWLLRFMGNVLSLISPTVRHMMRIRDIMNDEMRALWRARKTVHKYGEQGELLVVLREY